MFSTMRFSLLLVALFLVVGYVSAASPAVVARARPSKRYASPVEAREPHKPSPRFVARSKPSPKPKLAARSKPSPKLAVRSKPSPKLAARSKPSPKLAARSKPSPKLAARSKPSPKLAARSKPSPKLAARSKPSPKLAARSKPSPKLAARSKPSPKLAARSKPSPRYVAREPHPPAPSKRALAVRDTNEQTALNDWDATLCPTGMSACPVEQTTSLPKTLAEWAELDHECVELETDLQSCGGCASIDIGHDCTAIEGSINVACISGGCEVQSCASGYSISFDKTSCIAD